MKGRERFLTALENKKTDVLPCQVHNWMPYYLSTYLRGMSDLEAYRAIGMDPVLYRNPLYIYDEKDLADWQLKQIDLGKDEDGNVRWRQEVTTPEGMLVTEGANNQYTSWITRFPIQTEKDFELWNKYIPLPVKVDWTPVREAKRILGDDGIVRGSFFDFGQGSPWQSFSGYLYDTEKSIYQCFDDPDWVHYVLKSMLEKKLRVIEIAGKFEYDLVETGGGGGSSTVISPDMHREFCLPYDKIQHKAIREAGSKVVYHLCGGVMPLLETVVENGADALETMTPASMGGDCVMEEAARRVGDKLAFIGGFDQNEGFERGNKEFIRKEVRRLFEANPNGGYICSPSDHFFFGDPENLKEFVQACKECRY